MTRINRREIEGALQYLPPVYSALRLVPYFKAREEIGLRVFGSSTKSIFHQMGIRNGDILLSVNGKAVKLEPNLHRSILEEALDTGVLRIELERAYEPMELFVIVKGL